MRVRGTFLGAAIPQGNEPRWVAAIIFPEFSQVSLLAGYKIIKNRLFECQCISVYLKSVHAYKAGFSAGQQFTLLPKTHL